MSEHLNALQSLIDKLSSRERILVLVGALSIVYVIWDTFLITPIQKSSQLLSKQHQSLQRQITDLEARRIMATGLLNNSKRKQLVNEIVKLEKTIKNFDGKILERLQGRVAPEYMSALLNDVLQKNQQLELLSINNLPAVPFVKNGKMEKDDKNLQSEYIEPDPQLVGIFLHPLEVELQGGYLDILKYLQALEAMEWKIYWDQVKLEVLEYPNVKVQIKVHTFSLKEGWLSV